MHTQMTITKSQGMWSHYTDERKQYHVQKELEATLRERRRKSRYRSKLDVETT